MSYKLSKGKSYRKSNVVGYYNTSEECYKAIKENEDDRIYYFRMWILEEDNNVTVVDYGSWSTFYFLANTNNT